MNHAQQTTEHSSVQQRHSDAAEKITQKQSALSGQVNGIEMAYQYNADEVRKGLIIFQKHTIYPKMMVYTLLIGVLLIFYVRSFIQGDQSAGNYLIAIAAVTVLVFMWYLPWTHIRRVVKSVNSQDFKDDFILTVYPDALEVVQQDMKKRMEFGQNAIRVWETADLFVISGDKVNAFVVPKRCLDVPTIQQVSDLLLNGLGTKYRRLIPSG